MIRERGVRLLLLIACASALLSGCSLASDSSLPTPYPPGYLPTVIHMTAEAIQAATHAALPATDAPTQTATATATLVPPTAAPSLTPTPGPGVPLAVIQNKAPGPMSRIVSPLQVQVIVVAGDSKRVEIDLFGEDGSLLARTLRVVGGSPEGDPLSVKIPFEIRAAGETGYVQVSTRSTAGRIQALTTLPVLLLSSGSSQINPPGNTIYERVVFGRLTPGTEATGGTVPLEGLVLPYNRQQVVVDLISNAGTNLSTRLITTTGTDWQSFDTTLPYKVDKPTPARIYVHQADDLLSTPAYVYSQPILLNP